VGGGLDKAWVLYRQGRWEVAASEIVAELAASPESADAHRLLALCRAHLGRPREAYASAREGLRLAPDDAWSLHVMGEVHAIRGRWRDAEGWFARAASLDPANPRYRWARTEALVNMGKPAVARKEADHGLALAPESAPLHALRGLALLGVRRMEEAEASLRSALSIDPDCAMAHAGIAWRALEEGRAAEAEGGFREALRADPNYEWARAMLLVARKRRMFLHALLARPAFGPRAESNLFTVVLAVIAAFSLQFVFLVGDAYGRPGTWAVALLLMATLLFIQAEVFDPLYEFALSLGREGRLTMGEGRIRAARLAAGGLAAAAASAVLLFRADARCAVLAAFVFLAAIPVATFTARGGPRAGGVAGALLVLGGVAGAFATLLGKPVRGDQFQCGAGLLLAYVYYVLRVRYG
jgi:tetratricopeptide (TPR) repeat protein